MLKFNDPESAKKRAKTKPLTLKQEMEVVKMINDRMYGISQADEAKIQRFINHYQNLSHFKAAHTGLWATDLPGAVKDPKKVMFEIK